MDAAIKFWNWFKNNNKAYLFMQLVDEDVRVKLFNDLTKQLHEYSNKISCEITGEPEDDQELVITASGNRDYFEIVENLVNAAPTVDSWIFTAFKNPVHEHFSVVWEDLEFNTENIWFLPLIDNPEAAIGVIVFLKCEFLENEILLPIVYSMLNTLLGEKSFAVDIDYFDVDLLIDDDPEEEGLFPIMQLPKYINLHKSMIKRQQLT